MLFKLLADQSTQLVDVLVLSVGQNLENRGLSFHVDVGGRSESWVSSREKKVGHHKKHSLELTGFGACDLLKSISTLVPRRS